MTSASRPSTSEKEPIPYSSEALRQDLQRVRDAWDDCQATRKRNLWVPQCRVWPGGVVDGGGTGTGPGSSVSRSEWDREDVFAAIIRCTADPAKADKRTRSKWSRVMRYAAAYKPDSEPLEQFVRRKGGINACAARFTRWLGRGAPRRTES